MQSRRKEKQMKKLNVQRILFTFLLFFLGLTLSNGIVHAEYGAEVPTNGEIVLYDNATSESTKEPKTSTSTGTSTSAVKKPKGKLPSTGELVGNGLVIGGLMLVLVVGGLYFWKRGYRNERKEP